MHINNTSKSQNAPTTGHIYLTCAYKGLLLGPSSQEGPPPWGPYLKLQLTSSDPQCELNVSYLTHGCRVACPMTC